MSKIGLRQITLDELKPLITLAFKDDPELLEKYSLLKDVDYIPTLQESVDRNYETIIEAINNPTHGGFTRL